MGAGLPATLAGIAADHSGQAEGVGVGHHDVGERVLVNIVLPDGGTVGQRLAPQVDEAYATGKDAADAVGSYQLNRLAPCMCSRNGHAHYDRFIIRTLSALTRPESGRQRRP